MGTPVRRAAGKYALGNLPRPVYRSMTVRTYDAIKHLLDLLE
ncbi:hypothetical protein [Arthrobacter sp. M4]|nr:hypothetical protein [Arthrobacter sp. M4]